MIKYSDLKKDTYTTGDVASIVGLTSTSIYNYIKDGTIKSFETPGGHNRISKDDLINWLDSKGIYYDDRSKESKIDIIYARVSSQDQKANGGLDRQITDIITHITDLNNPRILTDVGSGLNDKRRGLATLMSLVSESQVSRVFVTTEDRLSRFGINILKTYFTSYGVELITISDSETKAGMQELVDDMMSLVASFSGRYYGLRSAEKRRVRKHQINKSLRQGLDNANGMGN